MTGYIDGALIKDERVIYVGHISSVGWAESNEAQQYKTLNVGLCYRSVQPTQPRNQN